MEWVNHILAQQSPHEGKQVEIKHNPKSVIAEYRVGHRRVPFPFPYFRICFLFYKSNMLGNFSKMKLVFIEMEKLSPTMLLNLGRMALKRFSMYPCAENPEDIWSTPFSPFKLSAISLRLKWQYLSHLNLVHRWNTNVYLFELPTAIYSVLHSQIQSPSLNWNAGKLPEAVSTQMGDSPE